MRFGHLLKVYTVHVCRSIKIKEKRWRLAPIVWSVTSFIAFHIINSTSNNARLPEAGHEHHEAKCLEKEIVCTSGGSTLDDGGNDTGVEEYHHGIENEEARTVVELEHVVIHENLRDERWGEYGERSLHRLRIDVP